MSPTDSTMGSETGLAIDELDEVPSRNSQRKKVHRYPGFRKCRPVDRPVFASNRHDFEGPLKFQIPNPNDAVYWSALAVVEEFQKDKPFEKFANQLFLSALNCAPTIMFSYHETVPVVHALYREGMVMKVQLKMVCDIEVGWFSSTVLVRDGDRWITLRSYLTARLPKSAVETTGQVGYWIQHRWWRSMNKPFRLMDLPTEIRDQILLQALGEKVLPILKDEDEPEETLSIVEGTPREFYPYTFAERIPAANLSILRLNKELAAVTKRMLFMDTIKVFHEHWTLCGILRLRTFMSGGFLRRMQLAMSSLHLVNFFEVDILPFNNKPAGEEHILTQFPSLRDLTIVFPGTDKTNAWLESRCLHHDAFDEYRNIHDIAIERVPCQKVFVDMVMSFAAPHLRTITQVKLAGLVKTCSKRKWENLLNKTSFSRNEAQIQSWRREFSELRGPDLPPRCLCARECSRFHYDFDYDDIADPSERIAEKEKQAAEAEKRLVETGE